MITTDALVKQQRRSQMIRLAAFIVIGLIALVAPIFSPMYLQGLMTKILIFAVFAASLDILLGYTGLFSLGHAAYFGMAGYTTALLATRLGIQSFWLTMPASILVATLLAAIFGLIALRVSGLYFLLVTFAFGQMLYGLTMKWYKITGGSNGLPGVPRPPLGLPDFTWSSLTFYYFVLLVSVCCFFLMYRFIESPFGRTLRGIRECEPRMRALGYNTWLHKYIAFIVGGFFAGVGGVLFAHYGGFMHPSHLAFQTSGLAMLMVIVGGAGTLYGSIIGAAAVVLIEFYASVHFPDRWYLVLGGIFVLVVVFLRGGIAAHVPKLLQLRVSSTNPDKAAQEGRLQPRLIWPWRRRSDI